MTKQRIAWGSMLVVVLLAASSLRGATLAEEPNQAALVIQFDPDRVETRCISFSGDTIRGDEMLEHSGLEVINDPSAGMGVTVCKIEGLGCSFPADHCFCQCMGGGPCTYWNYFYRDPDSGDWVYSPLGAALRKATPGSVEAWVWGDGHTPPAEGLTFDSICGQPATAAPTQTAESEAQAATSPTPITPEATSTAAATAAAVAARQPTATAMAAATATAIAAAPTSTAPAPTAAPGPTPAPDNATALSTYWPFGLVVVVLALIAVAAWLRRT